jgi:hypothetical protein
MPDEEPWLQLCEQAAAEQDPTRLMELVKEIDRLLNEKEERLRTIRSRNGTADSGTGA